MAPTNLRDGQADTLRGMRLLRWITRICVYAGVTAEIPFDHYVNGLTWQQAVSVHLGGYVIATVAIELAFGYAMKLRKRNAFPQAVLVELGSGSGLGDACRRAVETINRLLSTAWCALLLPDAAGNMRVAAVHGADAAHAEAVWQALAQTQEPQPGSEPRIYRGDDLPAEARGAAPAVAVVPIHALREPVGYLLLAGPRAGLRDRQLLAAIAGALGSPLHNLRQAETLRATQDRLRLVVNRAPMALVTIDAAGNFALAEGRVLESLGLPPESLIGRNIRDMPAVPADVVSAVEDALAGEERSLVAEVSGRFFEARISPLRDAGGSTLGASILAWDVTEQHRAREALQRSEEYFRALIENASDLIFIVDAETIVRYASPAVERALGYSIDELVGQSAFNFIHPDDRPELLSIFQQRLRERGVGIPIEFRVRHKDGSWRTIEAIGNFNVMDDPRFGGAVFNARDITERKQAEQALMESEARFRGLFQAAGDVMYTLSLDGRLTSLNPAFTTVTGWPAEQWIGKHFAPLIHPDDLPSTIEALRRLVQRDKDLPDTYEWRVRKASGEYMTGEFVTRPLYESGKLAGVIGVVRDVTERRQAEQRIRHMAHHDPLTGLPNRVALEAHLQALVESARAAGRPLAVMFLDLDYFKQINDTHGHEVGDALLRQVAETLKAAVRDGDIVARFGGDEFVVIVPNITAPQEALEVAERIQKLFARPYQLNGWSASITVSIGVAVYPLDGEDLPTLLRRADNAMYQAKSQGRNAVRLFSPGQTATAA
jgi:diguanylate cyclase (GGDEF)-like protein/PAS domain S-box-containing protein